MFKRKRDQLIGSEVCLNIPALSSMLLVIVSTYVKLSYGKEYQ